MRPHLFTVFIGDREVLSFFGRYYESEPSRKVEEGDTGSIIVNHFSITFSFSKPHQIQEEIISEIIAGAENLIIKQRLLNQKHGSYTRSVINMPLRLRPNNFADFEEASVGVERQAWLGKGRCFRLKLSITYSRKVL